MKNIQHINTTVVLNNVEQEFAKSVAKQRYQINNKNKTHSKIEYQHNFNIDLNGFGAELAFCILFNLYPDTSIFPRNANSDLGDAKLHNGMTVDIKASKNPNSNLLVKQWKPDSIHLYALMIGEFPVFTFKGFMTANDIKQQTRLKSFDYGLMYYAYQHELKELYLVT